MQHSSVCIEFLEHTECHFMHTIFLFLSVYVCIFVIHFNKIIRFRSISLFLTIRCIFIYRKITIMMITIYNNNNKKINGELFMSNSIQLIPIDTHIYISNNNQFLLYMIIIVFNVGIQVDEIISIVPLGACIRLIFLSGVDLFEFVHKSGSLSNLNKDIYLPARINRPWQTSRFILKVSFPFPSEF